MSGRVSGRRSYSVPLPNSPALSLGARTLVMGILNVTPDSFAELSASVSPAVAIARGLQLEQEGADLIDVGGESTRPGTDPVSADEELARVLPVIKGLAGRVHVPISVDTYKAAVASEALVAGASIVNDISGLQYDPQLGSVAAACGAAVIVMHMRGNPKTMYAEAGYGDVVNDVVQELRQSVDRALQAGVSADRVIVDPGIGFAKRASDSYGVLARLDELIGALDWPVLVGPSRKSFMREAAAGRPAPERDWGTAAAITAAVLAGAHIVRVHAVAEMVQVVHVAEEIRKQRLQ